MIIIYHDNSKVHSVWNESTKEYLVYKSVFISKCLIEIAEQFPENLLIWCHILQKEFLNIDKIPLIFHHQKIMASFNLEDRNYFSKAIGYVDQSPFIKINKKVSYPTWQMSSQVGGIYAVALLAINTRITQDSNFNYYLHSVAKLGMPQGLICTSEPELLIKITVTKPNVRASSFTLFKFVKQHYKTRWFFLLIFHFLVYEKHFPLFSFLFCLFFKKRNNIVFDFANIQVQSMTITSTISYDVIIPTIGRKEYLYNVLKDFKKQHILPNTIIIVEQNPEPESKSELDYIYNETWPFKINHTFTHQTGACNARNIALSHINSEWVFLADDDNVFNSELIAEIFNKINSYGAKAVTTSYLQKDEKKQHNKIIQWPTFGAGNSFVKKTVLENIQFNKALEFGYGEDADFGMQLRNKGVDILYLPEPEILHLKAPVGGFRIKPNLAWHNDPIQPKPSPTVMLYYLLHYTPEQVAGYKTILFFKYYTRQSVKNPIQYYLTFIKQWERSIYWANQLKIKQ